MAPEASGTHDVISASCSLVLAVRAEQVTKLVPPPSHPPPPMFPHTALELILAGGGGDDSLRRGGGRQDKNNRTKGVTNGTTSSDLPFFFGRTASAIVYMSPFDSAARFSIFFFYDTYFPLSHRCERHLHCNSHPLNEILT